MPIFLRFILRSACLGELWVSRRRILIRTFRALVKILAKIIKEISLDKKLCNYYMKKITGIFKTISPKKKISVYRLGHLLAKLLY